MPSKAEAGAAAVIMRLAASTVTLLPLPTAGRCGDDTLSLTTPILLLLPMSSRLAWLLLLLPLSSRAATLLLLLLSSCTALLIV
jgi:hypothetical protein